MSDPTAPISTPPANPVIFFDGVCALCNGFTDFVMARDRRKHFHFATLQGETAAGLGSALAPPPLANGEEADPLRSMLLWDRKGMHQKSEAALRTLEGLGGLWKLARVLRFIPVFVRDAVYDFIARNRYRWFGKRSNCRLPTPEERDRFLP